MIFETPRLKIRSPEIADVVFFTSLFNQPSYLEHLGGTGNLTIAQTQEILREDQIRIDSGSQTFLITIKGSEQPTGIICFKRHDEATAEISAAFLPEFEGQGYAFEAAEVLIRHVFTEPGVEQLIARMAAGNTRPQKSLLRLGMTLQTIIDAANGEEFMLYSMRKNPLNLQ